MGITYSLSISAHLQELAPLRCFVEEKAEAFHIHPVKIHDILLTIDELVTNIILHGYDGRDGPIGLKLRFEADELVMILTDSAPVYDPTKHPSPDITLPLEKRPLGGMGIHLARRLMDEMRYRVTENGENELTLIKRGVFEKEENYANHS